MMDYRLVKESQKTPEWSGQYTFVISIRGNTTLITQRNEWVLCEKDICMIPPFQHFFLSRVDDCCLIYQIDFTTLPSEMTKDLQFVTCNSTGERNKNRYKNLIVFILSSLIQQKTDSLPVTNLKWTCCIFEELVKNFGSRKEEKAGTISRMGEIVHYITEHYKEDLTLTGVANHFYVSTSYISKLFKEEVGMNFLAYLNEIRLMYAAGQILDSTKSIGKIAEEYGFKNVRSFSTKFKEYYHILPSEYRRQLEERKKENVFDEQLTEKESDLAVLEDVLSELCPKQSQRSDLSNWKKQVISNVDVEKTSIVVPPQRILTIRKADHLLMYQTRETVKKMVEELGITGIYFHELFHDDMEIYRKSPSGENLFSFYKINHLFDFLEEFNITLYIELSFVPFLMAKEVNVSTMTQNSVSNMPQNMDLWKLLVKKVVEHLIQRYGIEKVRQWRFCVWNSPDNIGINQSAFRKENYYELYEETYKVIKKIDLQLQVGTPALMSTSLVQATWMNEFAEFYHFIQCKPDFVMFNLYTIKHQAGQIRKQFKINYDRDAIKNTLKVIYRNNVENDWRITNWVIAEWSYLLWGNVKLQDSIYQANYLIKSYVDLWEEEIPMGIADPVEGHQLELPYSTGGAFYGRRGLMTVNGIKKASWYACEFLKNMGNELVKKGENFLITKTKDQIQILLYNYQHLSQEFCNREMSNASYGPDVFEDHFGQEYEIGLDNVKSNTYVKETIILNDQHGSSFEFCERYRLANELPYDATYLNEKNQPLKIVEYVVPDAENNLSLYERLLPLEIRLICLTPV